MFPEVTFESLIVIDFRQVPRVVNTNKMCKMGRGDTRCGCIFKAIRAQRACTFSLPRLPALSSSIHDVTVGTITSGSTVPDG